MAEGYHHGGAWQNTIRADAQEGAEQTEMIAILPARRSGARRHLALLVVRGDLGRLGPKGGVFLAKHLGAEPDRGIDLRLAKRPLAATRPAQRVE